MLKLFLCVLEKWKMQITYLNDCVKLYKKKKIVQHVLNEVSIYFWIWISTLFFMAPFAFRSLEVAWNLNYSVRLSPVATELSRSRLQSGNYPFTQSSSAGDLPVVIPLPLVYCLDRQVQTCLSIVCYSTRVVLCGDTTVCKCFSCSCSISEVKFSFEVIAYFI